MQFKWTHYVEYSKRKGIFNIKNNDEILSVPRQYLDLSLIDLSNKIQFFKTFQRNKTIHILKAWNRLDQEQCSTLYNITPG